MRSTTTQPPTSPPEPFPDPSRHVPGLDRLIELTSVPDERVVFRDVDWAFYEQLVDSIPEGIGIRVGYDGKDVEIMSLSGAHDGTKKRMGRFVELVSDELDIAYTGLGSTTWKRRQAGRGLEADECYFFAIEKLTAVDEALRRMSRDIADYPDPDLAIEVDVSPSKIDRPGIYAALRVAEVWRYDGRHEQIVIERLTPDGTYQAVEVSGFLPVRAEEVSRWVLREDCRDWARWSRGLRAWVQAELITRLPR